MNVVRAVAPNEKEEARDHDPASIVELGFALLFLIPRALEAHVLSILEVLRLGYELSTRFFAAELVNTH